MASGSSVTAHNVEDIDRHRNGSSLITKQLLQTAIRPKTECPHISVKTFEVSEGSQKGDNYASVTFSVEATVDENGSERVHNLFIKTTHDNELMKEFALNMAKLFPKEELAYSSIIPEMIQYQIEHNIEPFGPSVPFHYYSAVDNQTGIIILEDLRIQGYELCDKRKGASYEECKLIMKELAIFHALSFALKNRRPDSLMKHSLLFQDGMVRKPFPPHFVTLLGASIRLMNAFAKDNKTKEYITKLQNIDLEKTLTDLLKPVEPFSLICHGDLWLNNVFFKYKGGHKDEPIDVKLLDLQIMRYALPTTDLAYFFFTSTTRTTRKKHMKGLLHFYHSTFMECLERLNLDFPEFPFSVLEKLYIENSLFGVLFACMLLPMMLTKPEAVEDFSGESEADIPMYIDGFFSRIAEIDENIPFIEERLIGAVVDAVEMSIL